MITDIFSDSKIGESNLPEDGEVPQPLAINDNKAPNNKMND